MDFYLVSGLIVLAVSLTCFLVLFVICIKRINKIDDDQVGSLREMKKHLKD